MTTEIATTMNQLALGDVLKDEAIDRVESKNERFVGWAMDSIRICLQYPVPFTSDDVWMGTLNLCTDPRAMGAAIRKAHRDGLIEPTGRWVKSTRAACHSRPVREWRGTLSRTNAG